MSTKKKFIASVIWVVFMVLMGVLLLFKATSHAAHTGGDVTLKDSNGADILLGNTVPYSPEMTCGLSACHAGSFNLITSGYHFQQGKDEISDTFSSAKPWVLSPGMFGKW